MKYLGLLHQKYVGSPEVLFSELMTMYWAIKRVEMNKYVVSQFNPRLADI